MAVLSVLLFHLSVPGFSAGFLGVDVFFVLSGFLITSLLLNELDSTGRVSLSAFWSSRIRRLLPALGVLLLTVALVTASTTAFSVKASIRGDLLSTIAYAANWHLIHTAGYFDQIGVPSPLQHTWSLAIEEQFYIVWPLVVSIAILVAARPRRLLAGAAGLAVVASALGLAMAWATLGPDRAYMGTDTRVFEPLLGCFGAIVVDGPRVRDALRTHAAVIVSIALLVAVGAFTLIRPDNSLYYVGGGFALALATLLVVMSVWVNDASRLARILATGPLVWVGLISYAVYLWHWPWAVWLDVPSSHGIEWLWRSILVVALTFACSIASYHLIEIPVRRGRRGTHAPVGRWRGPARWRPRVVLASVPLVLGLLTAVSVEATTLPPIHRGQVVVMLTGDSVPLHLEPYFDVAAADRGWRVVSAAHGGCSVTGEVTIDPSGNRTQSASGCPSVPDEQDGLVERYHPAAIVWWDRWSVSTFVAPDGSTVRSGSARFWALRARTLDEAVRRLTSGGGIVVLVGTEPPGGAYGCGNGCPPWHAFLIDHYDDVTRRWNAMLEAYARAHPTLAAFISITDRVCARDEPLCPDDFGGVPARPDGTHYDGPAATFVARLVLRRVADIIGGSIT